MSWLASSDRTMTLTIWTWMRFLDGMNITLSQVLICWSKIESGNISLAQFYYLWLGKVLFHWLSPYSAIHRQPGGGIGSYSVGLIYWHLSNMKIMPFESNCIQKNALQIISYMFKLQCLHMLMTRLYKMNGCSFPNVPCLTNSNTLVFKWLSLWHKVLRIKLNI